MSRKNNLNTRKNAHKFALESTSGFCTLTETRLAVDGELTSRSLAGERANALKKEKKAAKTAERLAAAAPVKKAKSKGIRIRKGVRVKARRSFRLTFPYFPRGPTRLLVCSL